MGDPNSPILQPWARDVISKYNETALSGAPIYSLHANCYPIGVLEFLLEPMTRPIPRRRRRRRNKTCCHHKDAAFSRYHLMVWRKPVSKSVVARKPNAAARVVSRQRRGCPSGLE